jgi:kynurenine formamidase
VTSRRLVDLSHEIEAGMITYAGLPAPIVSEFLSREASVSKYSDGTTFSIGRVEMVANTGTYIDAPFHRHPDEPDLSGLPLEKIANLEGVVVHAAPDGPIGPDAFSGVATAQKALLVRTDWSARWGGDDYLWSDSECAGGSVTGWPVKPVKCSTIL